MRTINRIELAQSLLRMANVEGGFTYWTTGIPCKHGYMVAQEGAEVILNNPTAQQVAAFITSHYMDGHSVGGWFDNGCLYLDVSDWYNDKTEAMMAGVANKQLAIYEIHTGNCITL